MSQCVYEQFDERTTRVTGPRFIPATELRVKLEGAGKVGERYVGMVGVRDPYTISRIDEVIAWAQGRRCASASARAATSCTYTVYGRDGILGELEPLRNRPAHELCIVVQGVAPTKEMAEEVCMIGTRQMFYARLPNVKGTAGGVAFLLDEVMPASAAYRWTLNHTMRVDDPLELFPVHHDRGGGLSDGDRCRCVRRSPRPSAARMPASTRSRSTSSSRTRQSYDLVRRSGVLSPRGDLQALRHSGLADQRPRRVRAGPRDQVHHLSASCRAAASATPTSSAASNMGRCSASRCRSIEPVNRLEQQFAALHPHRHCEERSDEAIQRVVTGLLRRFAPRNDGGRTFIANPHTGPASSDSKPR